MIERRSFLKILVSLPFLSAVRPLPDLGTPKRPILLKEINIAGLQYHDGADPLVLQRLTPGDRLDPRREPHNPYDPSALAVYTKRGEMLGYVPMIQNRTMARIADQGIELRGELVAVYPERSAWDRVRIRIFQMV